MARDFTKNTANYMSLGAGAIGPLINGAGAVSFSAIVTLDTITGTANNNRVISAHVNAADAGLVLAVHNGTSAVVRVGGRSRSLDGFQTANGTTALSTGTEYQIGGVLDFANDLIRVYVDGTQEASTSVTFGNASFTYATGTAADMIGANNATPSTGNQVDGRISEVCIWAGDIGDDGFAQLGDRISPALVRPDLIVDYLPLMGANSPERGWFGNLSGTITGTVAKADHPRIILPRGSRSRKLTTASGGSVAVTPTTAALVLTTYAPTVSTPVAVTPTTTALTLTTFAPTVSTPVNCTPSTAALTLTAYAPTVATPVTVTPSTTALVLTTFAPTVSTPVVATPSTAALTLTTYAPTVTAGVNVTPTTAALTLTGYAPTVATPVAVTPSAAALVLTTYAPTVTGESPDDGGVGFATKGVLSTRKPASLRPTYRVFDTYSSKSVAQQHAQAAEQEQIRVRKVANRRAAILAAVMAACEDDYGL